MDISAMMGKQLADMQRVLSMNLLKSQLASDAAFATVMLEDMKESQPAATHPTLGNTVDIKV